MYCGLPDAGITYLRPAGKKKMSMADLDFSNVKNSFKSANCSSYLSEKIPRIFIVNSGKNNNNSCLNLLIFGFIYLKNI